MFLKISQNSQENTFARISFLIKLQAPCLGDCFWNGAMSIFFLQNILETLNYMQRYLEHSKKSLSVREDRNLNYCDVIALEILMDHECQWPQDSLNCESLKYRSWNIVLNFTYFNCKIANISMMYRHWAIFS